MKTFRFILILLLCAYLPAASAITVSESVIGDFPNTAETANSYTLDAGGNDFVGQLPAFSGDADYFKVIVPPGIIITGIASTGGGFTPPSLPLYPGTYALVVQGLFISDNNWVITFTGIQTDYTVTTNGGQIVVTDRAARSEPLTISEPSPGNILFTANGRVFRVNNTTSITGNSGNLSLSDLSSVIVNAGGGNNTVNVGGFSGNTFPNLVITGGTNDDTVNFNGSISFAQDKGLTVDLQNNGGSPGADTINVAANVNLATTGFGPITFKCSRNVSLSSGAVLQTVLGAITVEANQQAPATPGNFIGVNLDGATIYSANTSLNIPVNVKGRGGNDPGGYQLGVQVINGAQIISSGDLTVIGTGGASSGIVNRGVTVYGAGSAISCIPFTGSSVLNVTGTAGSSGSYFGIGVSVLAGGVISCGATGSASITGTGAGAPGSGYNQGIEMGGANSRITSSGGNISVTATAGPGGSSGLFLADSAQITTPAAGGNITISSDSISVDSTAGIATGNAASSVQIYSILADTIALGGGDVPGSLGLDATEFARINTTSLTIGNATAGINLVAPVDSSTITNLTLVPHVSLGVVAAAAGTDISLPSNGTVNLASNSLACAITGPAPDSGFPQLKVAGHVNVSGATLNLTGSSYVGAIGNTFTIVDNDGSDPIIGTFSGLSEGAYLPWPGSAAFNARISYVGGDGNDVVLTLVDPLVVATTNDSGGGSLRGVLAYAATKPGADVITLAPALAGQTITLASEIVLTDSNPVTIDASGLTNSLTLSGNNNARIFYVDFNKSLTLKGLNLTGGGGHGGNFNNAGGAICCGGSCTLQKCTLTGNAADLGGAIYVFGGSMTLTQCTLAGNSSGTAGSAIDNEGGVITLDRCTLTGNFEYGSNEEHQGGAILNTASGAVTLTHCTVSSNSTAYLSGAIDNTSGTMALTNCIITGNEPANVIGSITGSNNITSGDPLLAPLGNYGGPTMTMALLPGSPARNAAIGSTISNDQRGFPIVGPPDIGAYEAGTLTDYDAWAWETIPANYSAAAHAREADPDGDGRINAVEYASLSSATISNSGSMLTFSRNAAGTINTNSFNFLPNSRDVVYWLDRSTNLNSGWNTIFKLDEINGSLLFNIGTTYTFNGSTNITVKDPNIPGLPSAFYRLRVTVAP